MNTYKQIREYLINKGLRPSHIRIRVFRYLLENRTHPSAEEIFSDLVKEMPTLSRTSVYNTLRAFCGVGLVKEITIESDKTRFDVCVEEHGHFQCRMCGKIYDFRFSGDRLQWEGLEGFAIESKELYLRGLCPECKLENENKKEVTENGKSS